MNSNSKGHYEEEKECGCKRKKEEVAKVLLKCKASNPVTVIVAGATPAVAAVTTQLAKVTLNTERFHDPCIKFEFSTNLVSTIANGGAAVALSFQLFKLCKGETIPEAIGNPWAYPIGSALTDIISFIVCDCSCDKDCDCDNDCCSYYVAAITSTTTAAVAAPLNPTTTLLFNNPTFSALVVDNTNF
ncbi:DUF4489 domain-containing protein [Clostridium psychrophilum]|uniref:DUF4489 domain-containing protein n=1 Tax=Clostridium psychrophilum TaxID=132926 RepID=UPI001C0E749A|nr:DUF4489 domain-containing protein [Clostridium psychrophilum]MBU3181358.1 DUF4489 domain-containing protein [Clostridium psychrophilum]